MSLNPWRQALRFYARWFTETFKHSWNTYETFTGIASLLLLAGAIMGTVPQGTSDLVRNAALTLLAAVIVARGIAAPFWIYRERDDLVLQLRAQLERKDDRKRIRERLGEFILEGRQLRFACAKEDREPPFVAVRDWEQKVEAFLTAELGKEYVALFRSSAGMGLVASSIESKDHAKLWMWVYTRETRLGQFLGRGSDAVVADSPAS